MGHHPSDPARPQAGPCQVRERALGLPHGRLQQCLIGFMPAADRGLRKQFGPRGPLNIQAPVLRALANPHGQVEPCVLRGQVHGIHPEPFAREPRLGRVLHAEGHLEQRSIRHVSRGAQHFHQLLEREILVGEGLECGPPHTTHQIHEPGGLCKARSQDQRIDEKADHPIGLAMVPPRQGRPDNHVCLSGELAEQRLEPGQEDHEWGGVQVPAEGGDRGGQRGFQRPGQDQPSR